MPRVPDAVQRALGDAPLRSPLQVLHRFDQPLPDRGCIEQELSTFGPIHGEQLYGLPHLIIVRKAIIQGPLHLIRGLDRGIRSRDKLLNQSLISEIVIILLKV